MQDIRIEKLAKKILTYSINLQKKENLLVEILGEDAIPLGKEIIKQAELMGASPFFNIINYGVLRAFLQNSNEEQIKLYSNFELEKMKKMNAYIAIKSPRNINELADVDKIKLEQYNKHYIHKVHLEQRVKNTKWCILSYPNKQMAQKVNMGIEEYETFYFNVCLLDYDKMSKAMDKLVELMRKTDKVHILGPGTDLSFSIKNIPVEKYIGTFNIPDGEVATSPVKNSVNGHITYNTETTFNGITFKDIRFDFQDGKIVKAISNKEKEINDILNIDEGARYIGEFALGLNPFIDRVIGDTLYDEKVMGSFHFTPGDSLADCDNGNRSAIHWDIVNIQTPEYGGGEIYFDNVLIRKDGRFVLKELKALNPENLK